MAMSLVAIGLTACSGAATAPTPPASPGRALQAGSARPLALQAPRPGCGYGDDNHSHQAAPGLDPRNFRPGKGAGDPNHQHTAPPGQAPVGGGVQGDPMFGCKADPGGR